VQGEEAREDNRGHTNWKERIMANWEGWEGAEWVEQAHYRGYL
jgi:hypothetical protein